MGIYSAFTIFLILGTLSNRISPSKLIEVQVCPSDNNYNLIADILCPHDKEHLHCVIKYPLMTNFVLTCQKPVWFAQGTCPAFVNGSVHSITCQMNTYTDRNYQSNDRNMPKKKHICNEVGQSTYLTNSSMDNLCFCQEGYVFADSLTPPYCNLQESDCSCLLPDPDINSIDKDNSAVSTLKSVYSKIYLNQNNFAKKLPVLTALKKSLAAQSMTVVTDSGSSHQSSEIKYIITAGISLALIASFVGLATSMKNMLMKKPKTDDTENSLGIEDNQDRSKGDCYIPDAENKDITVDLTDEDNVINLEKPDLVKMRDHCSVQESQPDNTNVDTVPLPSIESTLDDLPTLDKVRTSPITKTIDVISPEECFSSSRTVCSGRENKVWTS